MISNSVDYNNTYCVHKLPCGICRLTNCQCPKDVRYSTITCQSTAGSVGSTATIPTPNCSTNTECIVNCGKGMENR